MNFIRLLWRQNPISTDKTLKKRKIEKALSIICKMYIPFCQEVLVLQLPQMDQEDPKLNK